ncbi:serine hydrolase domain-containing protein [Algoriphagus halophilus]|uniref:serine hydrolase domain-containing protein n=1 Tax=Algoriphagus halophilus TaxID=226505 RepID=UPI00358FA86B
MIKSLKSLLSISIGFAILLSSCTKQEETSDFIVNEGAVARLDSTLQAYVNSGNVAGISALIYGKDQEVYFNAFGFANKEKNIPMDRNTIVQIYSMTKPITGTSLMTLYEEGKFHLDDPLEKYAPEFANMKVYQGVDENGKMILVDAERPVTIRDITRHTAGFPNRDNIPGLSDVMKEKDARSYENTLTVMAEKIGSTPYGFNQVPNGNMVNL